MTYLTSTPSRSVFYQAVSTSHDGLEVVGVMCLPAGWTDRLIRVGGRR